MSEFDPLAESDGAPPVGSRRAPEPSTGTLVTQLTEQASALMRQELRLAQAEIQQKIKRVALGSGLFGAAGLIAVYGLGVLIAAGILGLALVIPAWLSALLVGVLLFVIAGIAVLIGKKQVDRGTPLTPERSVDNLKRDVAAMKGERQ